MRVTVVHGYYLHDSGSGTYVRELTRQLVRQGHDVTLVCQERRPDLYDFIDATYDLDEANTTLGTPEAPREPRYAGRCRLVRPNLGGRLLVFVKGPFPGFAAAGIRAFPDAPVAWIEDYVAANVAALRAGFAAWPPDAVLANHAIMQPHVVRRALGGAADRAAPYVVTVHGSELNFSIKRDPRLVPYAIEGLGGATAIAANTESSTADVVQWAQSHFLDIAGRAHVVSPGVNTETFSPAPTREAALETLRREVALPVGFDIRPEDDILAFAGRVMWTKGIQHAVAALPLIAARRPRTRLLVAGDGPARGPLERLVTRLERGDTAGARELALGEEELRTLPEFGAVLAAPAADAASRRGAGEPRVAFLGHLTSDELARVFAAADVSLAPSVFPEALGLVTMEGLSAGALPVASYHSGLASIVDVVSESMADPAFRSVGTGGRLTEEIAALVVDLLRRYPTADPAFRTQLHDFSRLHFPTWESVARRYLELAGTSPPFSPE